MRIPPTEIWLAAALTLGMGVARGDSQPALVFSNQSFENFRSYKDSSVLVLATLEHDFVGALVPTRRTFAWRTNDQSIQIKEVNLYALDEATKGKGEPIGDVIAAGQENRKPDGNESNFDTPAFDPTLLPSQPTTTSPGGGDVHPRAFPLSARQTGSILPSQGKIALAVSWSATGGSVTIDDVTQLAVYSKATLFFGVQWVGNTSDSGETYSGAFAVVNNEKEAFEITRDSGSLYRSYALPVLEEYRPSKAKPTYLPYPSSVTPTAKPSGISESASNESQSGLATGAIIGIAVACGILGLLLVLGAIWFLIRRRSKQAGNTNFGSPGRPYGTERSRTDDLIAEKEASAGGADPSPHSPYSDDGVVLVPSAGHASTYHNGGPNGSVVLGTPAAAPMLPPQIPRIPHQDHHHEQVGPYATYSDRGSIGALGGGGGPPSTHAASITHSIHDETNRAGMGSPTAGRATPHSVLAPQYAHLVEEGMTEDEIRRLEDEERQLDAEIERAGRR